jgi:hypothetical protein
VIDVERDSALRGDASAKGVGRSSAGDKCTHARVDSTANEGRQVMIAASMVVYLHTDRLTVVESDGKRGMTDEAILECPRDTFRPVFR